MSLVLERTWPYVLAAAWLYTWYHLLGARFPTDPSGLLSASGTAAAVLVGFLATANAIVLGLSGTELFKRLSAAKYISLLYNYFYEAIAASIVFLIVSIVGFFMPEGTANAGSFPVAWMATGTLALFLFFRVNQLLFSLIRQA